jgi:aminopeptidase N
MDEKPVFPRMWVILLVLAVSLVGCKFSFPVRTPAEELPAHTPTRAVRTTTSPVELPGDVQQACPIEEQALAMRVESSPELESIRLPLCYDLQLELQPEGQKYSGSGRIVYHNQTGEMLSDLILRTYPNAREIYGGELQVTSAKVNGVQVKFEEFLDDRTALRVPLRDPLPADSELVLEVEFHGQTASNFNRQSNVYGIFNYDPPNQVLTMANWYPMVAPREGSAWEVEPVVGLGDAVVSEAALYRVQVSAPQDWHVVTTGVRVDEERRDGILVQRFSSGPVRDFTLVASPRFEEEETEVGGVLVRHWGLPGGEDSWSTGLNVSQNALALFDERFGSYPYNELDVIAVPLNLASGVEYPGLILIDQALYTSGSARPGFFEIVVSHEVAHQWWYAVVGNDVIEHPWQDEALTTFSSLLYQQEFQPQAYRGTLDFYRERVDVLESSQTEGEIAQPVEAFLNDPGAYSPVVYIKGALFFVELRRLIGEDAFFTALRDYYADHMYELVQPRALLQSFETACNCQLDDTYQEWGVE